MSFSNQTAETLAAELGNALRQLRDDLRVVLGLMQALEHHAAFVTALAQGQVVRVRRPKPPPPADGQPRARGRPKGAKNRLTVFASPQLLAQLGADQP